jgi:sulfatase maturation enzyme AslB (radical SAM superfamily)
MSNASGRRLAAQSFKWLLREPSPRDVLWLNYAVTYRCNSRCAMCSIWQLYRKQPQKMSEEIDRASIEAFLESSRLKHLIGISFTGGEPLLRCEASARDLRNRHERPEHRQNRCDDSRSRTAFRSGAPERVSLAGRPFAHARRGARS